MDAGIQQVADLIRVQRLGQAFAAFRGADIHGRIITGQPFAHQVAEKRAQGGEHALDGFAAFPLAVERGRQAANVVHGEGIPGLGAQDFSGLDQVALIAADGVRGKAALAGQMGQEGVNRWRCASAVAVHG